MFYDPISLCPKLTIQEAIDLGILPADFEKDAKLLREQGIGRVSRKATMFISNECLNDILTLRKLLFAVKTPDITEEEIKAWSDADACLDEPLQVKKRRLLDAGFKFEGYDDQRANNDEDFF